jgi:FKBP-type peptidyl-prolyl cis-trans isomerase SlyD
MTETGEFNVKPLTLSAESERGKTMQIEKNKVVTFHYDLRVSEHELYESSRNSDPMNYLHGHGNIVYGLEKEMTGKVTGDKFTVTVEPVDGYGLRNEQATQRIPIKHISCKGRLRPGMMVAVNTREGQRRVTVLKVGKFNADVDLNHPLAGKTLTFDVEIVEVREASTQEINHGHAHGPGGDDH